ncbi:hypothetical protein QNN86_00400 [Citrobacter sp. C348]|uniref:Uncharacterized protein n=1 Tax=Citrobacter portucalensis TaxID=1639133 RepID=A0A9X4JNT7_9ENTR|nr:MULTISPECIES: hypothetical protein [Citrobacter freundii complex]EJG2186745.1 hypothetical protein [Citrobacter freundii]MDE9620986.1 hypothetical protein [Citrobacter portucalensis]QMG40697.1 hypothetical protein HVY60_08935 [Citrobacter freundii]
MNLTPLQIDILKLLAMQGRNANAIQRTSFPGVLGDNVNDAIYSLRQQNFITAVQSKANDDWLALKITPDGKSLINQMGWLVN